MAGFDWFWKAMGGKQGRNQKRSLAIVDQAAARVAKLNARSDEDLVARAREITASGEVADAAEFLAILSIAATRTLGMTPFPVQLQAVLRLLEGDVIQMATGEGKTLVGAMANTGFGLMGKRVHSVTVNDYLAARDAERMSVEKHTKQTLCTRLSTKSASTCYATSSSPTGQMRSSMGRTWRLSTRPTRC